MRRILVLSACAAALALARQLPAQERPPRHGFWFGVGLGSGWAHVTCDICKTDRPAGVSGYLRLGGSVSRSVLIGAEVSGWRKGTDGVDLTVASVGATAHWYPDRRRSLYLKGGVGYVLHRAADATDVITTTGFGPQMGIGYDVAIGSSLSLSPYVNAMFGSIAGKVKFNAAQILDHAGVTLLQIGLALSGH